MPASVTQQAIRQISKHCAAALAAHGFKRLVPHLHRLAPSGVYHLIHFQASQWGSRDSGSFAINLAVSSPWLYTHWTGRSFPRNPASALWPIQERIGHLMPVDRDTWWDITADTDPDALGPEIARALVKYALPFFAQYPDTQAILDRVTTNGYLPGPSDAQRPLIAAILYVERQQTDAARAQLLSALQKHAGHPFEATIRVIASRLGINLS